MSQKQSHNSQIIRPGDRVVIGVGLAAVAALVWFAVMRPTASTAAATSGQAVPQLAPKAEDHAHGAESGVPRLTAAELKAAMDRREVTIIDVRDLDGYAQGHIPGAMHIPLNFVESQVPYLPKDRRIVAYCT